MPNIQLVTNADHKNIRIITRKAKELGDNVMLAGTFPLEFRFLQSHYPILFQKNSGTDTYNAVALFGFESEENLFLDQDGWSATYIPLMMQRQPFHIGLQKGPSESAEDTTRVMQINMDSPRVSEVEGERLFLDQGGNTEFLERMATILETIHLWSEQGTQFDEMLTELGLLEPVTFDITLDTGRQSQLLGFYTINEEKLKGLPAETFVKLNEMDYLMPIYMAIASLSNIKKLVTLKSQVEANQ